MNVKRLRMSIYFATYQPSSFLLYNCLYFICGANYNYIFNYFSEPTKPAGSPPQFVVTPKSCDIKEGKIAKFTYRVTGEPTPDLTWFYKDEPLELTGRYSVVERDGLQVLQLTDVTPEDGGEYKVTATNEFGDDSCTADLDVEGNYLC